MGRKLVTQPAEPAARAVGVAQSEQCQQFTHVRLEALIIKRERLLRVVERHGVIPLVERHRGPFESGGQQSWLPAQHKIQIGPRRRQLP